MMKENNMITNNITIPIRVLDRGTLSALLQRMFIIQSRTTHLHPHPGLIIAEHHFNEPYPLINECDLLSLAVMDLLKQFAYPNISGYTKFSIVLTMNRSEGEAITFTPKGAIALTTDEGRHSQLLPAIEVYNEIVNKINLCAEMYDGDSVQKVMIRVYRETYTGYSVVQELHWKPQSDEVREENLSTIFADCESYAQAPYFSMRGTREIRNRKRSYPSHIPALKVKGCSELSAFIVADLETILIDNVHFPYAAGLLMVRPGDDLTSLIPVEPTGEERPYGRLSFSHTEPVLLDVKTSASAIETYFSEDHLTLDTFEERSCKVLYDFIKRIESLVRRERKAFTIYFHNGSRFDGVILLKHLTLHHKYKLKPLIRNRVLYELGVYSRKKLLFRFKDSMKLLPGSLATLAKNLCPELGPKGDLKHDEVTLDNVSSQRKACISYLKQDILLLGGVMKKAKEIYLKQYKIDIESVLTISSLAITIFRSQYYDESHWPIHIPNKNEDSFIRGAYYGGHVDVYKPKGENLYYYDVNSLYGRFGISPKSSKSEICDHKRYHYLLRKSDFQYGDKLDDNKYIATYLTGADSSYWKPPKNSAVQLPAAITACARIFMYPFISRDDCYYTDTDSIVLGQPLPPEDLSETVLGKFKLVDRISQGYFLAPKAYCYETIEGKKKTTYKGAASSSANYEWFESQYYNISRRKEVKTVSNFIVDRHTLDVRKKESKSTLQINPGSKRKPVYDEKDLWVETLPMEIYDFSLCSKTMISALFTKVAQLQEELERVGSYDHSKPEQELASTSMGEGTYGWLVREDSKVSSRSR